MLNKRKVIRSLIFVFIFITGGLTFFYLKISRKIGRNDHYVQKVRIKSDGTLFFTTDKNQINNDYITLTGNSIIKCKSNFSEVVKILKKNNIKIANDSKNNLTYKLLSNNEITEHLKQLNKYQRYSHFPITGYMTNKYRLLKSYNNKKAKFPNDYNFLIESYILPKEKDKLKENFKNSNLWISKPYNLSRGRQVNVINDIKQIKEKKVIVSKYIKPHTLFGKKYDIRIMMLITSYDPLIIYLYTDGVLRFATHPYSTDKEFYIEDKFMHLTNNCVNKDSIYFKANDDPNLLAESVASLKSFRRYCDENKIDYKKIISKVKDFVIKCVLLDYDKSINILKKEYNMPSSKNIFELLGVDIILDENLEPHILEINLSPSLNFNCKASEIIYEKILVDTFNIIGIKPYDRGEKIKRDVLKTEDKIKENIDELKRERGGFELIFPLKENIDKYRRFISKPSELNVKIWDYIKNRKT